jgi:hypothetical protein
MKAFIQIVSRRLGVLMLALTSLAMLAGGPVPTAYAATHAQASMHNISLSLKPARSDANPYIAVPIDSTSGRTVTFGPYWGNAQFPDEVTDIYYGDGHSDQYWCELNCVSTTFTHTYPHDHTNYHVSVQLWWYYPQLSDGNIIEQATSSTWVLTN